MHRFGKCIEILLRQAYRCADARPIAGKRGADVFIDGAGCGALRVELGIVLIREDQGLLHGADTGPRCRNDAYLGRHFLITCKRKAKRPGRGENNERAKKCALPPPLPDATQHTPPHAPRVLPRTRCSPTRRNTGRQSYPNCGAQGERTDWKSGFFRKRRRLVFQSHTCD